MDFDTLMESFGYLSGLLALAAGNVQLFVDSWTWISDVLGWVSENLGGVIELTKGLLVA
ncbi:MAG: hypothetical protein IK063_00025 [Clostridia bacterium]|nr:hypothetical protein [Clostridia bacterium]